MHLLNGVLINNFYIYIFVLSQSIRRGQPMLSLNLVTLSYSMAENNDIKTTIFV